MRTSVESNHGLSILMDFPRQVHVPDAMDNRIAVLSFYANGHCQCKGDMYIKVQSHHPHDTQSDMNRCPCKQIIPPPY